MLPVAKRRRVVKAADKETKGVNDFQNDNYEQFNAMDIDFDIDLRGNGRHDLCQWPQSSDARSRQLSSRPSL
jgi:hypothetical protein